MSSSAPEEHASSTNPIENESNNASSSQKPEGEALREAIRKQIDYYFSKENLATDRYLISQMNTETFVPIKTIASFKMIKSLTTDLDLVVSVMKECKSVVVDESTAMVKPNLKAQRTTLILRDIPSSTPVEEIKGIFDETRRAKITDVKSDIGDCWYVSVVDEDTTLEFLEYLMDKTFKEKPVKARVKTENAFRNFFPGGVGVPATTGTAGGAAPYAYPYPPYTGGAPVQGGSQQNWSARGAQGGYAGYEGGDANYQRGGNYEAGRRGGYRGGRSRREYSAGERGGERGERAERSEKNASERAEKGDREREARGGRDRSERSGRSRGGRNTENGSGGRKRRGSEAGSANVPQLVDANFPPLPSMQGQASTGYTTEFKKFTKQQLVDIIKAVKDLSKPDSIGTECKMLLPKPITELEITKPYPRKTTAADIAKKSPSAELKKPSETVWQPTTSTGQASSPAPSSPVPTPASATPAAASSAAGTASPSSNAAEATKSPGQSRTLA